MPFGDFGASMVSLADPRVCARWLPSILNGPNIVDADIANVPGRRAFRDPLDYLQKDLMGCRMADNFVN